MTTLSGGNREVPGKAAWAATLSSDATGYVLDVQSGSFDNSDFPNLALAPAQIRLARSERSLLGWQTTQFEGTAAPSGSLLYVASVQLLGGSGIGSVGMGHWKYLGDFQPGYFGGYKTVHGAFLIGQPASLAAVAALPTGSYSGFSQGGSEDAGLDEFPQTAARTSVYYDAATHTITIRLSGFKLWGGVIFADRHLQVFWEGSGDSPYAAGDMVCSGSVDMASGIFNCRFAALMTGSIKGKFFGPNGEYVAGTYVVRGVVENITLDEALVGSFVARRSLSPVLPAASPDWALSNNALSFSGYVGNHLYANIQVTPPSASALPVYAVALDSAGKINPDVKLSKIDGTSDYNLRIAALPYSQPGTRSGAMQLRLCHDDPLLCTQPVAGSPWPISYQIETKIYPGPGAQAAPLTGTVVQGVDGWLSTSIVFNQPSVNDFMPDFNPGQYYFTITDSGILTPKNTTGFWSNQEPRDSFSSAVLGFIVPANTQVGLYEGVIAVSVCGRSSTLCLPVAQPTLNIPYKVEVQARAT